MSGWDQAFLGDLVEPVQTWNPLSSAALGTFDYIDLGAVDRHAKRIVGSRQLRCVDAPSRARQVVAKGDVLVSTVRPNLNGVALVPEALDGAIASTGFCVLRAQPTVLDSRYVFQWVKSPGFVGEMTRRATGASYPAVSDRIVLDSRLPLPPMAEQRRIADVLDRADALRAQRRAALAELDTLTQAIFLELFGDPATNPKAWPLRAIRETGTVVTGNTPSRSHPEYFGSEIEWIKSDNIDTRYYYLTRAKESLSQIGKAVARFAPAGSLLVTCIAGSPECIGNSAMTDREVAFNQQINAIIPVEGDAHFLYAQFRVGKRMLQAASTAGMKGMVSKSRFERIPIIFPPVELQRDFSRRVAAVEKLKATYGASLANLDALYASLQHRAFRGEL